MGNKEEVCLLQLIPDFLEPRAVRRRLGLQCGGEVLSCGLRSHRLVASVDYFRAAAPSLRESAQLCVERSGPNGSVRKNGASADPAPQRVLFALPAGVEDCQNKSPSKMFVINFNNISKPSSIPSTLSKSHHILLCSLEIVSPF